MLLIPCPWCGPRAETEFAYGGEAHIRRPQDPARLSDAEWADYLYMRKNPKGLHFERWLHAQGCRRWFNVARDTATNRIAGAYRMGEDPPGPAAGPRPAKARKPGRKKPAGRVGGGAAR
jgi:heterotetrameric sarcosine oxidase delta subunit